MSWVMIEVRRPATSSDILAITSGHCAQSVHLQNALNFPRNYALVIDRKV